MMLASFHCLNIYGMRVFLAQCFMFVLNTLLFPLTSTYCYFLFCIHARDHHNRGNFPFLRTITIVLQDQEPRSISMENPGLRAT